MFKNNMFHTLRYVILGLLIAVFSQAVSAEVCTIEESVPQWVLDRQQYETTYVYDGNQALETLTSQFIADRYQYDPGYMLRESAVGQAMSTTIPQWVLDRRQYEITYTYVPAEISQEPPCLLQDIS